MRRMTATAITLLMAAAPLASCPFCAKLGRTLSDMVAEADWVGHGTPTEDGTGLTVETLVKAPAGCPAKGIVRFTKVIGTGGRKLVFARVEPSGGALTPTRVQAAGPQAAAYLAGANAVESRARRVAYFFEHLDAEDAAVRDDAYKALSKLNAAEIADQARAFDPEKLRRLIRDPTQPGTRIGLYGLLLGMVGRPEDAAFLEGLATARTAREVDARDGFLGGLALIDRKKAESIALRQLADGTESLTGRQAALNAVQFILDELPRRDPRPLLEGMDAALGPADLRDAVVDVLRLHAAWYTAKAVFAHADPARPTRAVVKFALVSPSAEAERFLAGVRKADPQLVRDCENALRTEGKLMPEPPFRISERRLGRRE